MRRIAWLGVAVLLGAAGPPPADPDWPCVQRLVPRLTAGTLWSGHDAGGDWHADPQIAALVGKVAPRSVPTPAAKARVEDFVAGVPAPDRPRVLPLVFAGLVDETNAQRSQIIERLRGITRRQRMMTELTSTVTAELRALPPDTPAAQHEEVVNRRALMIREYEEIERTIRYACEVPVQMESKLGTLAQVLQRATD